MGKIALKCKACGKTFHRYESMCKGPMRGLYCSKSCAAKNNGKTHGKYHSAAHKSWRSMHGRVKYQERHQHATICDRWSDFEPFYQDMGDPAEGMTLDRIDNGKGYDPDNCRWATNKQQARNRSITVWLEHDGRTQCLTDWASEIGISVGTLWARIKSGWSTERALTTPLRRRSRQQLS